MQATKHAMRQSTDANKGKIMMTKHWSVPCMAHAHTGENSFSWCLERLCFIHLSCFYSVASSEIEANFPIITYLYMFLFSSEGPKPAPQEQWRWHSASVTSWKKASGWWPAGWANMLGWESQGNRLFVDFLMCMFCHWLFCCWYALCMFVWMNGIMCTPCHFVVALMCFGPRSGCWFMRILLDVHSMLECACMCWGAWVFVVVAVHGFAGCLFALL